MCLRWYLCILSAYRMWLTASLSRHVEVSHHRYIAVQGAAGCKRAGVGGGGERGWEGEGKKRKGGWYETRARARDNIQVNCGNK